MKMHAFIAFPPVPWAPLAIFSGLHAVSVWAQAFGSNFIPLFYEKQKILISGAALKNRREKKWSWWLDAVILCFSLSEMHDSQLCCSLRQSRIFVLIFTASPPAHAKLHHHTSFTRDISMLMHKQASTRHPRGEKVKIVFGDDTVPKELCWHRQHALRCKYTNGCLWEESMFPTTCERGHLVRSVTSSFPLRILQCSVRSLASSYSHSPLYSLCSFTQICWFFASIVPMAIAPMFSLLSFLVRT